MKKNNDIQLNVDSQEAVAPNHLLCVVPCPQCGGSGIVSGVDVIPACCRCFNEDSSCCGVPVPEFVEVAEPCELCQTTGVVQT